jgi:hypothetical protein
MVEGGPDQAVGQWEETGKLWAGGIGVGWCDWGEFVVAKVRRRFGARDRREEERGNNSKM